MKTTIKALTIATAILATGIAASLAQDFDKGLRAYVDGDYATALREWKPLAEQGHAGAQYNLGWMYRNGKGVTQDYAQAVNWYRKAAEQGNAYAQNSLGLMYHNGDGVTQDYAHAMNWYRKAAEQGDPSAQYNLGVMYANGEGVIQDEVYAYMWWNIAASRGDETAEKYRDIVTKRLIAADISIVQKLARECVQKNYKGC